MGVYRVIFNDSINLHVQRWTSCKLGVYLKNYLTAAENENSLKIASHWPSKRWYGGCLVPFGGPYGLFGARLGVSSMVFPTRIDLYAKFFGLEGTRIRGFSQAEGLMRV